MDVKDKLFMIAFILVTYPEELLTNDNRHQPQISCRYLRHVYRFLWLKPKCNPDGTVKNPQCLKANIRMKICCCTYSQPFIDKAIKWVGQCSAYAAKSQAMPVCNGPVMIQKYPNDSNKAKHKQLDRKKKLDKEEGEEREDRQGKAGQNDEKTLQEDNDV